MMGMGFESCLSGLNGCSKALEVTGNNIANSNTVGFKTGEVQFADVFAATLTSGTTSPQAVGLGTSVPLVAQSFVQGAIRETNRPLDMAINGNGFFRLDNGAGTISYTRNGEFQLEGMPLPAGTVPTAQQLREQSMRLVNSTGLYLTGFPATYTADPLGAINATGSPQNIAINSFMPGTETTSIDLRLNLDAGATAPSIVPFNPSDSSTYNYMTRVNAYSTGGTEHNVMLGFVKSVPQSSNTWDMHVLDSGRAIGDVDLGTMTLPIVVAGGDDQFTIAVDGGATVTATLSATSYSGLSEFLKEVQSAIDAAIGHDKATVSLDENNHLVVASATYGTSSSVIIGGGAGYFGTVAASTGQDLVSSITFDAAGQIDAASQIHSLDFGVGTPVTLNLGFSTQYAGKSSVSSQSQNGYASGQFGSLSVGSTGIIQANYSNGMSQQAAQLVLANFNNPDGLINIGDNQWARSFAAGAEILDTPGNFGTATAMGLGTIHGGAVEEANVDLNDQLVNLITQQRHYQANAQAVKTRDQMLQTLANIR